MSIAGTTQFQAGRMAEAISEATAAVKRKPVDSTARFFLAELLAFAGELQRADGQLDIATQQEPEWAVALSAFRQLLRGEMLRQRLYVDGDLPMQMPATTTDEARLRLEAIVCLRVGQFHEAKTLIDQADAQRKPLRGKCDGQTFEDLRDLDDCLGGMFEVLTSNGTYYWLPFSAMLEIEMRPPKRPRDMLWRSARLLMRDGAEAEVHVPALYVSPLPTVDEATRLGRCTDWHTLEGGVVRGLGQKTLLVGDRDVPIMRVQSIEFESEN